MNPSGLSGYIITGSICVIFLFLGLYLLSGRGGFLIAGYNTMSKAKKEQYDDKALCRFVGWLLIAMIPCILITAAGTYLGLAWLSTGAITTNIALLSGAVVYANTGNRFRINVKGE